MQDVQLILKERSVLSLPHRKSAVDDMLGPHLERLIMAYRVLGLEQDYGDWR